MFSDQIPNTVISKNSQTLSEYIILALVLDNSILYHISRDDKYSLYCTDPTKSDEKELQLGGEFVTKEVVEKSIPWWKRYPNRLLIIRQPLCLMCLSTNRKYFISKPQLPCISIQCTNTENKQVKVEEGIKSPEQENEQSEVIGQVDIQLKQISIPLPAWLVGLKDVFSATISPYTVLYNYITIPFREAFNIYDDEDNTTLWYTLNSIMDTIYLLDIVLIKPRVEFLDSGIVKTDFKSCGMNYLKSLQFKVGLFLNWYSFKINIL
ncbi:unnamed protein product [Trichobilharzia regenti]|nr:unnamed protein product [Trichobilharzia regenti]